NRRAIHRHRAVAGDVADFEARFDQRLLEGERATDGEAHQIVPPPLQKIARLVDERAVAPDPVARHVGADIEVRADRRYAPVAGRGDADERTRLRIEHAEARKI